MAHDLFGPNRLIPQTNRRCYLWWNWYHWTVEYQREITSWDKRRGKRRDKGREKRRNRGGGMRRRAEKQRRSRRNWRKEMMRDDEAAVPHHHVEVVRSTSCWAVKNCNIKLILKTTKFRSSKRACGLQWRRRVPLSRLTSKKSFQKVKRKSIPTLRDTPTGTGPILFHNCLEIDLSVVKPLNLVTKCCWLLVLRRHVFQ